MAADIEWDMPIPHVMEILVTEEDTDRLGHTNNTAYLKWMEEVSWDHISPIGMDWQAHEDSGKAMAITRTEIDYLASAYADDKLVIGTWITGCDGRLTSSRQFQIVRHSDGRTLVRAKCRYACIDMTSGRPARMPKAFIECHRRAMEAHGLPQSSE
ncbi:acyl-CoA thioesterase [Hahella ganghwensis]|uniref:acyl-CoA thioesterase n=1 Tax=Hahella ganghwensis TaxID=286420 RepID=UPI000364FFF1|nr:thioesterase family protein [Hahella ganghwensis]